MDHSMLESDLHWKYFLTVDQDLSLMSRYIEFSEDNFDVYSIELVRLFLSVCSEIDIVMKTLCESYCEESYNREMKGRRNPNIDVYRSVINQRFDLFYSIDVEIPKCSISRTPWKKFSEEGNPSWWQAHNDVKHSRRTNYQKANLANVIDAGAGLLVAIVYLIAGEQNINIDNVTMPNFFELPSIFETGGTRWFGSSLVIPERKDSIGLQQL